MLLLLLFAVGCAAPRGPIGFWSRNRLRADGARQGPWRTYYDSADTRLATRGRYRHDQPLGHWRYYRYAGSLERDDRYRRRGRMLVRRFHPNGRLAERGQARVEAGADTVHYYWYGFWQQYDSTGQPAGWELYDQGWRAARGVGAVPRRSAGGRAN
ncbi:hypothetical protein [Hymenobacter gummosus]|uniref:hypothetical protein n=1 Tax=Hymenobacter gummosus TaxID=1776032 RepID=UPI000F8621DE|nr:hypothetical protein [Hymenobacter gummosus]